MEGFEELNAQERLFGDEYLVDCNATQAAIRAGYSESTAKSAHQWIRDKNPKKPLLKKYIQKRLEEKEDALIAKQDEVLKMLTRVMRREESEAVVVVCKKHKSHYDENGKKVINDDEEPVTVLIPTKVSDANKAAEMLGKYYSLFTDRTQIEGISQIQIIDDIPKGADDE